MPSQTNSDQPADVDKQAEGPLPEMMWGRAGAVRYSLAALRERIEAQLGEELEGRFDILSEAGDEQARRDLVREAGEYVLAVESIALNTRDKRDLFAAVYSNLFGFGPLDALIGDETLTELSVEGVHHIFVRREAGDPEPVQAFFEDERHLRRIIGRILATIGLPLDGAGPFLEVGLTLHNRPARLSLVLPPLSPVLNLVLRLHNAVPATLDALQQRDVIGARGGALLRALASSPYGVLLTGESGTGKTVLLEALLAALPVTEPGILVERAAEIRPPEWITRQVGGSAFAADLDAALDREPALLAVDEIRADEAVQVVRGLESHARLLCAFRGSPDAVRLHNALGMALRRGRSEMTEAEFQRLLVTRLPFVVTMASSPAGVRLVSVREWQADDGGLRLADVLDNQDTLMTRPEHDLGLPDDFWLACG